MKTAFTFLILSMSALPLSIAGPPDGLCGENLKSELFLNQRPLTMIADSKIARNLYLTFPGEPGNMLDPFTSESHRSISEDYFPKGITSVNVLPGIWWNGDYNNAPALDLHNLVPANTEVITLKKDYPPGNIVTETFSNSIWAAGTGTIDGITVNFYRPPKGYEGDFARMAFYTLCIYPRSRWSGLGCNFCTDNHFPGLRRDAYRTLKAWSDSDPVDDRERNRNDKICEIQGNRNLFIDYPGLEEHIWGDKSNQLFIGESHTETIPLRSHYSISDDRIDLTSPYIPDETEWTINGEKTDRKSLSPAALGKGLHELRFMSGKLTGKLLIKID